MTYLESRISEWWQFYGRLGAVGYPSNYDLSQFRALQPSKCIVPLVDIPPRLVPIDRAMRDISPNLWFILAAQHCVPGPDRERCERVGISRSTYYRHLAKAHDWINGYLWKGI